MFKNTIEYIIPCGIMFSQSFYFLSEFEAHTMLSLYNKMLSRAHSYRFKRVCMLENEPITRYLNTEPAVKVENRGKLRSIGLKS